MNKINIKNLKDIKIKIINDNITIITQNPIIILFLYENYIEINKILTSFINHTITDDITIIIHNLLNNLYNKYKLNPSKEFTILYKSIKKFNKKFKILEKQWNNIIKCNLKEN
jgi:CRISPR/Cas system endoribonuclease Cas6 (RAMP superfamily)